MSVKAENNNKEMAICSSMCVCVTPEMSPCSSQECESTIEDTTQNLRRVTEERRRVILVGDFKCKKVDWETYESGGWE